MKYQFTVIAVKWHDGVNGNTYHSCRIIRHEDGEVIHCPFQYGYGDHYRQTAREALETYGWIECEPGESFKWEIDNDYPIIWVAYYDTKKNCKEHGAIPA